MLDDYDVGYGKPPQQHKFTKGKSGNPKGRPRRDVSEGYLRHLEAELQKTVAVAENGKMKKMTKEKILARQLVDNSLRGDLKALGILRKDLQELWKYKANRVTEQKDEKCVHVVFVEGNSAPGNDPVS